MVSCSWSFFVVLIWLPSTRYFSCQPSGLCKPNVPHPHSEFFAKFQVVRRRSYRLPDTTKNGPFCGPFFIVFPTRP